MGEEGNRPPPQRRVWFYREFSAGDQFCLCLELRIYGSLTEFTAHIIYLMFNQTGESGRYN